MEDYRRLERILDATTEGWWEWHIGNNTTFHSPGWYRMLDISEQEFDSTFDLWSSRIHPDDRQRVLDEQHHYLQFDDPWETEFRMLKRDGSYVWVESRGRVTARDAAGQAQYAVGLHVNIQLRKENALLKEKISEKENLIRGIMRASFASLSIYDFVNRKFIYSQGLVLRKLGYGDADAGRLSENFFRELIHPADQSILERHVRKIQQSKENETFECIARFRNSSGTYNYVAIRDTVIARDANGAVRELMGSAVDITRFKELKVTLDEHVKRLEDLSYRNSHELRAPVATILGLVNLIKHELQSQNSVQDLVDSLEKTVIKMDQVISEFGRALD